MFITFEGIDGCGKSTQSERLYKNLKKMGYKVLLTREPGGTKVAEEIRNILLHEDNAMDPLTEVYLYSSARMEHVKKIIEPALREGKIVISDRFYDSTITYQGYGRDVSVEKIKNINKEFLENYEPDITFFIDTPIEVINRRNGNKKLDRIELEGAEFMKAVRLGYLEISKGQKRFCLINGLNPILENENTILNSVLGKLKSYEEA